MSEDLLGPLRSAGTPDSEGEFSVDQRHALEKLRSYQLRDPAEALLKLVQSAVAAGARKILIDTLYGISVMHDGRAPSDDQLANLLMSVLTVPHSADERSLIALAIGVNAAMGTGREVEVACLRGQHVSRARVSATGVSVATETAHGFPSGWTTRITAPRLSVTLAALWWHCRYAPVPIYCNDRLLNLAEYGARKTIPFWQPAADAIVLLRPGHLFSSYYDPQHHIVEVRWLLEGDGPGIALPYPSQATLGLERLWSELLEREPAIPSPHNEAHPRNRFRRIYDVQPRNRRLAVYRGAAALLAKPTLPATVEFVLDGVVVHHEVLQSRYGFAVVLAMDNLRTDLSQFSLVRDRTYDAAMKQALERAGIAVQAFHQRYQGNIAYALSGNPRAKVLDKGIGLME